MRKTAVFRDPLFLDHDPGYNHVESPDRLKVINTVLDQEKIGNCFLFPEFEPAPHKVISLNHTKELIIRVSETACKIFDSLDPDTQTSPDSYAAACLAVGSLLKGVDMLMEGEIDNGFCLVRPPGHHAESDRSMGFCLFNNVAIAAHYGLETKGLERIMIVDWDLHHGNGTQHSFYENDKVLYLSSHQFPFYPGSGSLAECGRGKGEGYTLNIPLPGFQGDLDYATIFRDIVLPVGREYKPQLILLSAGFDIYKGDPLGAMEVTADGFAYMTRCLVQLAEEVCDGRLLVTLEGGYNLDGQRDGAMAVLSELCGEKLDTGYPTNLDAKVREKLSNEKSVHPAIAQAVDVAKKYWSL